MVILATGLQVRCIRWPYWTKEIAFYVDLNYLRWNILWRILTNNSMLQICLKITVKNEPIINYELLNIDAYSFNMFWNNGCTQSLVVSCRYCMSSSPNIHTNHKNIHEWRLLNKYYFCEKVKLFLNHCCLYTYIYNIWPNWYIYINERINTESDNTDRIVDMRPSWTTKIYTNGPS